MTPRSGPYLLIEHAWFPEVTGGPREALREFARRARAHDAEAGFTAIGDLDGPPGPADGPARYLVVREIRDDERAGQGEIVALLSITGVDDLGVGEAALVVAPEHRSRGIATLLIERLRAEDAGDDRFGTGLTGIRAVADGAHPAAGRIAARFGFEPVAETWVLLRMVRGHRADLTGAGSREIEVVETRTLAELRAGVPVPVPGDPAEGLRTLSERVYRPRGGGLGATVTVRHGADGSGRPDQLARLGFGPGAGSLSDEEIDIVIETTLGDLRAAGAGAVLAEIDPRDQAVVRACRRRYFQHDQSNLIYAVPLAR
ncbi:GNAT family N-acetyltransferase [Actinocorallia aurantiaca]|uniref:N-acetyltransferase domain-containing protein n=1 Tax=Actinocorallia aurantiaca TaxID=46204 RepID=A0ABN3UPW2_9ACTN